MSRLENDNRLKDRQTDRQRERERETQRQRRRHRQTDYSVWLSVCVYVCLSVCVSDLHVFRFFDSCFKHCSLVRPDLKVCETCFIQSAGTVWRHKICDEYAGICFRILFCSSVHGLSVSASLSSCFVVVRRTDTQTNRQTGRDRDRDRDRDRQTDPPCTYPPSCHCCL